MRFLRLGTFLILTLSILACETVIPDFQAGDVIVHGDTIILVDVNGKEWDISYAVSKYKMVAFRWEFGLGVNAIRPIIDPIMLEEGDRAYPDDDFTQICIATTINGDSRAYSTNDLNTHEVVDDWIGGVPVAVGW